MIELKVLQNLGLSEKEAEVYLALIELGKASVVEISRKAGTKRPTTYLVLDELKTKGLVTKLLEESRSLYIAEDPELLVKGLKQKLSDISELIPVLRAKFNRGSKPKIRFIEGKENLYRLYMNEIALAKINYFYGTSVKKFYELWPDLFDEWISKIWPKKIKQSHEILEIVANNKEDVDYAKKSIGKREVRIIPRGEGVFLADNVVTENKVYIFSLDNLFCVVIESEDIAKTYQTMVKLAWQNSIPAKEWK